MKLQLWIGAVCMALLVSCTQSADPEPVQAITKDLLFQSDGWVVQSAKKETQSATQDLFADYTSCVADNTYKFASSGSYEINEGATKCSEDDNQLKESGMWVLNSSVLIMTPQSGVPYQFTISLLTADRLVFTYPEIGSNGIVKSVTTITFGVAN